MKKILLSLAMIAFAGALVAGATGAFFNDTETSTGNVFAAGDIDLQIDNESYALDFNIPGFNGDPVGDFLYNPATSWELKDLVPGVDHFFDFYDLKPGDYGEDTISIHVGSNDAWMCAAARITVNSDETCTEPENADENGACVEETDGTNGDLADQVNFAFWADDGDNVLETCDIENSPEDCVDETQNIFLSGPIGNLGGAGQMPLADVSDTGPYGDTPIPGDGTIYIGKVWCFGDLTENPEDQDGQGNTDSNGPGTGTNGPDQRGGTGFNCDGSALDNTAQTDKVQGDMQFYAVQARNNAEFSCETDYTPDWNIPQGG